MVTKQYLNKLFVWFVLFEPIKHLLFPQSIKQTISFVCSTVCQTGFRSSFHNAMLAEIGMSPSRVRVWVVFSSDNSKFSGWREPERSAPRNQSIGCTRRVSADRKNNTLTFED